MKKVLWLGCLSYLLIGFAHVVIGSLLPKLLEHFGRNYSEGGSLIFAQFIGFLAGVLVSPVLTQRLGKKSLLLSAIGLLAGAELVYTIIPLWEALYPIGFIAGFGFGTIEAIIGTIVIMAFTEKAGSAMSRLEVFFGLGALIMPLLAGWFVAFNVWRWSFAFIAVISLAAFVLWARLRAEELEGGLDPGESSAEQNTPVNNKFAKEELPVLAVLILFFFLYVGTEMSFANFLPSIFIDKLGVKEAWAALSVSMFWGTMTIGRLFAGRLSERIGYARYIQIGTFSAIVLLSAITAAEHLWSAYAAVLLLGLMMSGLFAIALVFANRLLQGKTERTNSLLIASGGIGGAVLPFAAGRSMDLWGSTGTLWFLAGTAAVMFGLSAAIPRVSGSDREEKGPNPSR